MGQQPLRQNQTVSCVCIVRTYLYARQILDAYFNTHKQEAKAAGGKVPSQGPIQAGPAPTTAGAAWNPY